MSKEYLTESEMDDILMGKIPPISDKEMDSILSNPDYVPSFRQIEKQHPNVSDMDRFKLKAFGDRGPGAIEYLKKKGLEARVQDGRIWVKKKGEDKYHTVDPQQPWQTQKIFSAETAKDIAEFIPEMIKGTISALTGARAQKIGRPDFMPKTKAGAG